MKYYTAQWITSGGKCACAQSPRATNFGHFSLFLFFSAFGRGYNVDNIRAIIL
jgi:hypothetical protein